MLQGRAGGGGARLGLAAARTVRVSGYISGYISGGGARAISRGEARISAGEMRVLVAHRWVLHPRLEPGVMKKANLSSWGGTVRGTYGTPVAGTRSLCVQYAGQAALRLRYA